MAIRFELPFGIDIEICEGMPSIQARLGEALSNDGLSREESMRVVSVVEGLEHLLMSLAKAGVDLSLPAYATAVQDCVRNLQT